MSILSEVQRIGPEEALQLEASAKAGDPQAVVRFVHYALWRRLHRDRAIPPRKKPVLFNWLIKTYKINPEVVKANG